MMTRFQMELSGALGQFWQNEAHNAVMQVRSDFYAGRITIDGDGVARNEIGRALTDDLLEILDCAIPDCVNVSATRATRAAEDSETLKRYRNRRLSSEEMHEMKSAFGAGTAVVDVLSGERYAV